MFNVEQIIMGHGNRPKRMYLNGYDGFLDAFYGFFFIKNAEYSIIVDTGISSELYTQISKREIDDFKSIERVFFEKDISIADIDIVILTHLHFDHCGYLNLFKNKPVFVQKNELIYANKMKKKDLNYQYDLYKNTSFKILDGDSEIVPGINVLLTPGHTPGGQSVLINTENGITAITGFCCVLDNFRPCLLHNDLIPLGICYNQKTAISSMNRIIDKSQEIYALHDFGSIIINS